MRKLFSRYRKWVFLSIGCVLMIYAAWNTSHIFFPSNEIQITITPVVDQDGFAPIFIPESTHTVKLFQPTPVPVEVIPSQIVIEKIMLEAPVIPVEQISIEIDEQDYAQFLVPETFTAGWHAGSAPIGVIGNTVISGHHNAFGEVFKDLKELDIGDVIKLFSEEGEEFEYIVSNKMILPEKDEQLDIRLDNGRWILPTEDERLTLVTCWPEDSNSHRLIIVAVPSPDYSQFDERPPLPDVIKNIDIKTPVVLRLLAKTVTPSPLDECIARNASQFDVNIRANPSLNGEVIGAVDPGDQATCVAKTENNEWIKVFYNSIEGWISADIVDISLDIELLPVFSTP